MIPEVGGCPPETGFAARKIEASARGASGNPSKLKELCEPRNTPDWHVECNSKDSWTHSGKRLTQVCERGGRGLLNDECWSFPPASEREARMDDPTPRSKKDRETECVFRGLLFPSRSPQSFLSSSTRLACQVSCSVGRDRPKAPHSDSPGGLHGSLQHLLKGLLLGA